MHLGLNFERALTYALHVHGGHVRKETTIPYFSHLMAVSATVIEYGGSESEAIAALLHDAVEDQGGTPRLYDIRDRFGDDVADIVAACSDSLDGSANEPKEDWLPRKRRYLKSLQNKSAAILRVSVADKLHNARAIFRDAQDSALQPAVWSRFGGKPAEQTIAYYGAFYQVVSKLRHKPSTAELETAVDNLKTCICKPADYSRFVEELLAR